MNRVDARRLADSHVADFNVTGCLWVYKTKRNGRRKARLCLNGASQQEGVDYDQTYSSTLRHSSVLSPPYEKDTGLVRKGVGFI